MVPVPVAVRFVTFPVFQAVPVLTSVQVPEPTAMVRVLALLLLTPPLESVTL